jgi:hypothetical protein
VEASPRAGRCGTNSTRRAIERPRSALPEGPLLIPGGCDPPSSPNPITQSRRSPRAAPTHTSVPMLRRPGSVVSEAWSCLSVRRSIDRRIGFAAGPANACASAAALIVSSGAAGCKRLLASSMSRNEPLQLFVGWHQRRVARQRRLSNDGADSRRTEKGMHFWQTARLREWAQNNLLNQR